MKGKITKIISLSVALLLGLVTAQNAAIGVYPTGPAGLDVINPVAHIAYTKQMEAQYSGSAANPLAGLSLHAVDGPL